MSTYAHDLAALVGQLDLKNAIHVGHSTGGGEVARYIGRHGTKRMVKVVPISAVPPLMLKTAANPGGLPMEAFDQIRAGVVNDRAQFFKDSARPLMAPTGPARRSPKGCGIRSGYRGCWPDTKLSMTASRHFQRRTSRKILRNLMCQR
jgi:non-heme chloroperoxidase